MSNRTLAQPAKRRTRQVIDGVETKQIELADGSTAFVMATVRPTDSGIGNRGRRTDMIGMVLRLVNSCVYRASDILSAAVAQTPIMLARPAANGSKGRKVGRAMKRWLTGADAASGPGKSIAVMAEAAGDIEQVPDHDALALFNSPNPLQHGSEFWASYQSDKELTGNAYINRVMDGKGPIELWTLPSQYVRVIPSRETIVGGFAYGRGEENLTYFSTDDVWQDKLRPNPESPWYGMSWMRSVVTEIDIYQASRQSELAGWDHNSRPDMLVMMKDPPTVDQIKQLKSQLEGEHRGAKNRGKILIMGGLDAKPMGFAPKDMEYQGGLKQIENTIMGAAGIPESLFRLNDANLASSRTGHIQFARMTLLPRLTAMCDFLNRFLVPCYPDLVSAGAFFYFANPVPEDESAKGDQLIAFLGAGAITINEFRSEIGKDPIDGSVGDLLRVNGIPLAGLPSQPDQSIPSASAQQAPAPLDSAQQAQMLALLEAISGGSIAPDAGRIMLVQVFGQTPEDADALVTAQAAAKADSEAAAPEPVPDAENPAETAQEPVGADAGPVKQSVVMVFGGHPPDGVKSLDDFYALPNRRRKEVLGDSPARGEPTEDALVMRLKGFFRDQRDHVRAEVMRRDVGKAAPVEAVKATDEPMIDLDAWTKKLTEAFGSAIDESVAAGAHAGAESLAAQGGPVGLALDLANTEAAKFAERNQLQFLRDCRTVNETTEAAVQRALADGIEQGQSTLQIADAIAQDFNAAGPVRAVLIARTETANAFTAGQEALWAQSGLKGRKHWVLAPSACEFCVAAAALYEDGLELGEFFFEKGSSITAASGAVMLLDYQNVGGPALHPNDRCTLEFRLED